MSFLKKLISQTQTPQERRLDIAKGILSPHLLELFQRVSKLLDHATPALDEVIKPPILDPVLKQLEALQNTNVTEYAGELRQAVKDIHQGQESTSNARTQGLNGFMKYSPLVPGNKGPYTYAHAHAQAVQTALNCLEAAQIPLDGSLFGMRLNYHACPASFLARSGDLRALAVANSFSKVENEPQTTIHTPFSVQLATLLTWTYDYCNALVHHEQTGATGPLQVASTQFEMAQADPKSVTISRSKKDFQAYLEKRYETNIGQNLYWIGVMPTSVVDNSHNPVTLHSQDVIANHVKEFVRLVREETPNQTETIKLGTKSFEYFTDKFPPILQTVFETMGWIDEGVLTDMENLLNTDGSDIDSESIYSYYEYYANEEARTTLSQDLVALMTETETVPDAEENLKHLIKGSLEIYTQKKSVESYVPDALKLKTRQDLMENLKQQIELYPGPPERAKAIAMETICELLFKGVEVDAAKRVAKFIADHKIPYERLLPLSDEMGPIETEPLRGILEGVSDYLYGNSASASTFREFTACLSEITAITKDVAYEVNTYNYITFSSEQAYKGTPEQAHIINTSFDMLNASFEECDYGYEEGNYGEFTNLHDAYYGYLLVDPTEA